jgi:hypothetical protein
MNIVYYTTTRDFESYCAMGLEYRLYASWGTMQHWFKDPENVAAMAVAMYKGKPVGMAMLMKRGHGSDYGRFGVFVRSYMRRHGIGKKLVALVKKRSGEGFMVSKTFDHQEKFFDALGMRGYRG